MDKGVTPSRHRRAERELPLLACSARSCWSILLFAFLWDFWLGEIFPPGGASSACRNFIGSNYQAVVENADLAAMYSFNVVYVVDTNTESGTILEAGPEAPGAA